MVKILHLADVHLDSPFKNASYTESVKRRDDTRRVFANALGYAEKCGASVVLLSGDLFDSEFYTENTVSFLIDAFKSMPQCRFVISPGNHDPYKYGSPYTEKAFSENVFIFGSEEIRKITFSDIGLNVYGYAFTSDSHVKRPLEGFKADGDGFNVLCAHTDVDSPLSTYAPISVSELTHSGLDYAAFGHIHTNREIKKAGDTVYAYAGSLTGRDFSEHGDNGGILVTLDVKNGKKTALAERIVFCPWVYKTVTVNLSETSKGSLKPTLVKRLSEETANTEREQIIRLSLTGSVDYEIDTPSLLSELREFSVKEIENKTLSSFDYLGLSDDFSLRGEFYRTLRPMLSSENEQERRLAEAALRLGLNALSRTELE